MNPTGGSEPIYCSTGVQVLKAPTLEAAGWEQRTVTDPERITELEDLYTSLGFDTTTTPLDPDSFGDACTTCAVTACSAYVAIFTRKKDAQTTV
ncbi:hypothetical protein MNBD_ACTINO01-2441 [hydrothermal vent metagenome]|uniref:Uncharacterized protein n=1 Tax=hydrothermal vent metagenome TaxID=652676 RepID=A0A3B0SRT0_9ZZZZ